MVYSPIHNSVFKVRLKCVIGHLKCALKYMQYCAHVQTWLGEKWKNAFLLTILPVDDTYWRDRTLEKILKQILGKKL